ncbi:MAG: putative transcriptional regulator [Rhodothermales bacterium]|jgi:predicted transcriptional regulator
MARSQSPTLTDAELKLMRVIWQRGASTVSDVVDALRGDDRVAYSTVQTFLRILEEKGYLIHRKEGRAFVYSAIVGAGQARQSALKYVLGRFFNNSPELLLMNVIDDVDLDLDNASEIRRLLQDGAGQDKSSEG